MSLLLIMSLYALVKAFVEKNLRFLAIHLLCGAGSFDLYKIKIILQRFITIAGILLVLSLIISVIVFRFVILEVVPITIVVSLILIENAVGYSYNKNVTVNTL